MQQLKFICNDRNMNYQIRLVRLNILPLNYWLEYLDLLFFYKCKSGIIQLNLENYVKYCNCKSRRGSSALNLTTAYFKTSLFRDSFFIRLSNIWNAVPGDIKAETTLSSFKAKLKSLYFVRLYQIFDGDNVRTFKLIVLNVAKLIFSLFALVDIVILFFIYIFSSWARLGVLVLRGRVFGCKYLVGDLVSYCI